MSEATVKRIVENATGQTLSGDALRAFAIENFDTLAAGLLANASVTIKPCITGRAEKRTKAQAESPALFTLEIYNGQQINGWMLFEKYDGVRALWNGSHFVSRNGNRFNAPQWFTQDLPNTPLDGELHMGRGRFQQVPGAVRRIQPCDAEWRRLRFHVFDAPDVAGAFAHRMAAVENAVNGCRFAQAAHHRIVGNELHMAAIFAEIVAGGGEGVVLRNPQANYGDAGSAIKHKPIYTDEAVVTGYSWGDRGQIRSLTCQWGDVVFKLGDGFTDAERENPPEIGAPVTFEYEATTDSGKPRFARFLAVRDYE